MSILFVNSLFSSTFPPYPCSFMFFSCFFSLRLPSSNRFALLTSLFSLFHIIFIAVRCAYSSFFSSLLLFCFFLPFPSPSPPLPIYHFSFSCVSRLLLFLVVRSFSFLLFPHLFSFVTLSFHPLSSNFLLPLHLLLLLIFFQSITILFLVCCFLIVSRHPFFLVLPFPSSPLSCYVSLPSSLLLLLVTRSGFSIATGATLCSTEAHYGGQVESLMTVPAINGFTGIRRSLPRGHLHTCAASFIFVTCTAPDIFLIFPLSLFSSLLTCIPFSILVTLILLPYPPLPISLVQLPPSLLPAQPSSLLPSHLPPFLSPVQYTFSILVTYTHTASLPSSSHLTCAPSYFFVTCTAFDTFKFSLLSYTSFCIPLTCTPSSILSTYPYTILPPPLAISPVQLSITPLTAHLTHLHLPTFQLPSSLSIPFTFPHPPTL